MIKKFSQQEQEELLTMLKVRFEKNMHRHKDCKWTDVEKKLIGNPTSLWSLNQMEITDGEPDVVEYDQNADEFIFYDCSPESPKSRRSICYDHEALEKRKENKPKNSAVEMAKNMGIELLTEEQYRTLQKLEKFDTKTSSWIKTPEDIRNLGGALFCDHRFNTVFVYHNGAESYYAGRGFRGLVKV